MANPNMLQIFNDHFFEFVNDIHNVFPNNQDIVMAKNSFSLIRRANPKMIIKVWNSYIVNKYKDQIEAGNMDFFINKDYSQDIQNTDNSAKITEAIDRLRNPIKSLGQEDQQKTMKYIQNLTKLAVMYDGGLPP